MTMTTDQLSPLLDGELDTGALARTLQLLASNADAREKVSVYQMVGDAMRGRAVEDDGYSLRILAALDREEIER